jgi:alpha-beta hydrolase superfamily lysophospholipase
VTSVRRASLLAALAAAPFAVAWRFALVYRVRAGFPTPRTPRITPAALGLPFEPLELDSHGTPLAAWFIPARDGAPGPGVVLVHGWESARDRTLPLASVLHAVGLHVLVADVRGHGANVPETLPVSGGEFGADALAAFHALIARPEVTVGAIHGHSMGGVGAILAAAADPRVAAVAATSSPADPYRLTRQTFRLARLPLPDPVAYPLAWWTTRVFLEPRGHAPAEIDASRAIARYRGPVLLLHGDADDVVPLAHHRRLVESARRGRADVADAQPVESLVIAGAGHSWLYEEPVYRAALARFLVRSLGGPIDFVVAAAIAEAVAATRIPDGEAPFSAVAAEPGGFRSLASIAGPDAGSRRALVDEELPAPDLLEPLSAAPGGLAPATSPPSAT